MFRSAVVPLFWSDYKRDYDPCWSTRLVPGNDDIHLETAALGSQSGTPVVTAAETSGQQRFYRSGGRCGTQTSSFRQKPEQLTAAPGCFYIYCDCRDLSDIFFFHAGPPAFLPPQTFLWDGVTDSFTRHRPLTCPNAACKKTQGKE